MKEEEIKNIPLFKNHAFYFLKNNERENATLEEDTKGTLYYLIQQIPPNERLCIKGVFYSIKFAHTSVFEKYNDSIPIVSTYH